MPVWEELLAVSVSFPFSVLERAAVHGTLARQRVFQGEEIVVLEQVVTWRMLWWPVSRHTTRKCAMPGAFTSWHLGNGASFWWGRHWSLIFGRGPGFGEAPCPVASQLPFAGPGQASLRRWCEGARQWSRAPLASDLRFYVKLRGSGLPALGWLHT